MYNNDYKKQPCLRNTNAPAIFSKTVTLIFDIDDLNFGTKEMLLPQEI